MTVADRRTGIRGLLSLYAEAAGRLRGSARMRRSLAIWSLTGAVFSIGWGLALAAVRGDGAGVAVLGAGIWWALVVAVMVGGATLLILPDGTRIDRYGVPNGLTAVRAFACWPLLLCAVWVFPHRIGFILWSSAGGLIGMLDFVDGIIARRIGPVTALGKAMDPAMDAVFFSMAAFGNVLLGILPWWMAALILFRYLGPLVLTPVVFLIGRRPELVHTVWGRRNTAAIGLIYFICMLVRVFDGPVDLVAAVVGLPLVVPTMLLHFASLWQRLQTAPHVGR